MKDEVPQWLKPLTKYASTARLKPCPFKADY